MPHATSELARLAPRRPAKERRAASQKLAALYALPIYTLPPELIMNVLQRLDLNDFPALLSGLMPLLRRCGIVHGMSTPRLQRLLIEPRRGFYGSLSRAIDPGNDEYLPSIVRRCIIHRLSPRDEFFRHFTDMPSRLFPRLPCELRHQVLSKLGPNENINVALASFRFSDDDIERLTGDSV